MSGGKSSSWVEERFLWPVVAVCASESADKIVNVNGLDTTQLLRGFAMHNENLYARTVDKGEVMTVRQFGVRLVRPECLRELDRDSRLEHFTQHIAESAEVESAYGEQLDVAIDCITGKRTLMTEPQMDSSTASILLDRSFPQWHTQFISDYVNLVKCSYFDTIDHPVAHLLVASTTVESTSLLEQLKELDKRTRPARDGMPCMDEEVLVFALIIHDAQGAVSLDEAKKSFAAVQSQYSDRCGFVVVNSVLNPEESKPMDCTRWILANPMVECRSTNGQKKVFERVSLSFGQWPSKKPKITGCCLSAGNLDDIQNVMSRFLALSLFPFLQRKLQSLTLSINEKRQSTFSKVAAWFRKDDVKQKSECWIPSTDGSPTKYLFSSLEIQMRRAGDISLFLRDFELAQTYYRMLRSELTSTLSTRDFNRSLIAATQEGIGLCLLFQGKLPLPRSGCRRDAATLPECKLEVARDEYLSNNVFSYAFRLSLLMFHYSRTRTPPANDRALGVIQFILKQPAVTQNKVYSALLHELCATSCLFLNPPTAGNNELPPVVPEGFPVRTNLRRYARYMTISGSAYLEIGQHLMSMRCYLRAYRVLQHLGSCTSSSRSLIYDHMHSLIAHIFSKLNRPLQAISYSGAAAHYGSLSFAGTAGELNYTYLWTQLRDALRNSNKSDCEHMMLPVVAMDSFKPISTRCPGDEVTIQEEQQLPLDTAEKEWRVLEDGLRSHYHERTPCTVPKYYSEGGAGRRGGQPQDTKQVTIPFGEHVVFLLVLRNPIGVPLVLEGLQLLCRTLDDDTIVTCSAPLRVAMEARSSVTLSLSFSPISESDHTVIGLQWCLDGVKGFYYFSRGDDCESTLSRLIEAMLDSAAVPYSPPDDHPNYVRVTVQQPQALLVASLVPPLPPAMRDGQLYRGVLRLENLSPQVTATHVTLQRSPANAHLTYFPQYSFSDNEGPVERPLCIADIGPLSVKDIAVVMRAQHSGVLPRCINNVPIMIGYAPRDAASRSESASPIGSPVGSPFSQHVRTLRLLRRVTVRPTISLSSFVSPGGSSKLSQSPTVTAALTNSLSRTDPPLHIAQVSVNLRRGFSASLWNKAAIAGELMGNMLTIDQGLVLAISIDACDGNKKCEAFTSDHDVVALKDTVRFPQKAATVKDEIFGSLSVKENPDLRYFATRPLYAGCGAIGAYEPRDQGDFSFYLDKAGGKSAEELEAKRRSEEERQLYGGNIDHFPPVCITFGWFVDEDGLTFGGCHFMIVDLIPRIARHPAVPRNALPATNQSVIEAFQQLVSVSPSRGAVSYFADVPAILSNKLPSHTATGKIEVTFQSWCGLPVRVEVAAKQSLPSWTSSVCFEGPSTSVAPPFFLYCGKVKHRFVLLPFERYTITLDVECFTRGVVNLNSVDVTVAAQRFTDVETTGRLYFSASGADSFAAQRLLTNISVVGAEIPWITSVTLQNPPEELSGKRDTSPAVVDNNSANIDTCKQLMRGNSILVKRGRGTSIMQASPSVGRFHHAAHNRYQHFEEPRHVDDTPPQPTLLSPQPDRLCDDSPVPQPPLQTEPALMNCVETEFEPFPTEDAEQLPLQTEPSANDALVGIECEERPKSVNHLSLLRNSSFVPTLVDNGDELIVESDDDTRSSDDELPNDLECPPQCDVQQDGPPQCDVQQDGPPQCDVQQDGPAQCDVQQDATSESLPCTVGSQEPRDELQNNRSTTPEGDDAQRTDVEEVVGTPPFSEQHTTLGEVGEPSSLTPPEGPAVCE